MLIFDHGFMSPPSSYAALLDPLRLSGIEVITPKFYSAAAGLTGRYTVLDEAEDLVALVRSLPAVQRGEPREHLPWLAGHSRGGQAAWRAAEALGPQIAGLIVVDPVDGAGPRSQAPRVTDHQGRIAVPTLIIGAGRGGSCAPADLNHETFARALPGAVHVVIADMGHADILSGPALRWGRLLCRGGDDPAAYRQEVSELTLEWLSAGP